jgi:small multidrug resistance family-3 protein
MDSFKTIAIFGAALVGELGGTYAIWRWRRAEAPVWLAAFGVALLFAYGVVQTYQPEGRYGRVFAAYAGVFLLGALIWGWLVDGRRPDLYDWVGAGVALVGAGIILWGRKLFS